MAPLKMLGCTVAIGGTAAGLQVARCTRFRPGLCPPGALPAPGFRPGLARAPGARLDSPESARPRPPCPHQPSPQQPWPQQPWPQQPSLRAQAPSSTPSSTTSSSPSARRGCAPPRRPWPLDARAAPSVCVTSKARHDTCPMTCVVFALRLDWQVLVLVG